jgi:hypothetical protein
MVYIEMGMMYITERTGTIKFPYDPELLEWLQEHYPYSKYYAKETTND